MTTVYFYLIWWIFFKYYSEFKYCIVSHVGSNVFCALLVSDTIETIFCFIITMKFYSSVFWTVKLFNSSVPHPLKSCSSTVSPSSCRNSVKAGVSSLFLNSSSSDTWRTGDTTSHSQHSAMTFTSAMHHGKKCFFLCKQIRFHVTEHQERRINRLKVKCRSNYSLQHLSSLPCSRHVDNHSTAVINNKDDSFGTF